MVVQSLFAISLCMQVCFLDKLCHLHDWRNKTLCAYSTHCLLKVQAVRATVSDFSRFPQFQSALLLKIRLPNVVLNIKVNCGVETNDCRWLSYFRLMSYISVVSELAAAGAHFACACWETNGIVNTNIFYFTSQIREQSVLISYHSSADPQ